MNYFVYRFHCNPMQPLREILISELADLGFDSFEDTNEGVDAYICEEGDDETRVREVADSLAYLGVLAYNKEYIPHQNWNEKWESDYRPVEIGSRCIVRAPFHKPQKAYDLDLVIAPQMSFGTGHHATTRLMLELLLDTPMAGKRLLDMGTGTGVLAIATAKCGAADVRAVDIDQWACHNAVENAALNNVNIRVDKGDARILHGESYEIILANINRNVLLNDLPAYASAASPGCVLIMSGFFIADSDEIQKQACDTGFKMVEKRSDEPWAALKLIM